MNDISNEKTVVYDVEDIMALLGIGHSRAYALMKSSGFPAMRIGRQFKVPRDACDRWLEASANNKADYLSDPFASQFDAIINAKAI